MRGLLERRRFERKMKTKRVNKRQTKAKTTSKEKWEERRTYMQQVQQAIMESPYYIAKYFFCFYPHINQDLSVPFYFQLISIHYSRKTIIVAIM